MLQLSFQNQRLEKELSELKYEIKLKDELCSENSNLKDKNAELLAE